MQAQERAQQADGSTTAMSVEDIMSICISERINNPTDEATEVFQMEVALPDDRKELKCFTQNSQEWVSKKLKKGAEIKWHQIPAHRLEDFQKAKAKEISNWIKEGAVKLFKGDVPRHRLMKMRWIFTIKHDNSAKARLVIIGCQDRPGGSGNGESYHVT